MYNPPRFKSENLDQAFELMDSYPFATVISIADGKPFVSHLPLTPKRSSDGIKLVGHLARANPHWKLLANSPSTAVFHGPHTYITPQWYAGGGVPTWNYSTVHASGSVELIEDHAGIVECINELTKHIERRWPSGWDFFIPDDLAGEVLAKSIVGFKINPVEINFKKKLSQNRSPADRAGVLRGLETRDDDNSRAILAEMQKLYSELGESR
jgi:transcriptional regulator